MRTESSRVLSSEPGQRMLLLFLLLLGCSLCQSDEDKAVEYGKTYRLQLSRRAHTVYFKSWYGADPIVLWSRDDPELTKNSRWKVVDNYFLKNNMTRKDGGYYTVRDRNQRKLLSENIEVVATTETYELNSDERLSFRADVELTSCNIYLLPHDGGEILLSHRSKIIDTSHCEPFYLLRPCGLTKPTQDHSCSGQFEVRDNDDETAMVVYVKLKSDIFNPIYLVVGGFVVLVIIVCCCVSHFCFARKSSGKNRSNVSEPVVRYRMYEDEPSGQRSNQVSEPPRTAYSAQPSHATTGPLVHSPPTLNVPPAYTEVYPQTQHPEVSTLHLSSDPEPRYELRGSNFTFTSPLSSTSLTSDVYTSEKLNFR